MNEPCVRLSVIYHVFAKKGKRLFAVKSENSLNFHFVQVIFVKKDLVIPQGKYTDKIDEHIIKYTR